MRKNLNIGFYDDVLLVKTRELCVLYGIIILR